MPNFIILDGARIENKLDEARVLNPLHRSLYRGEVDPDIEAVGPYLFGYPHSPEFQLWAERDGTGNAWGVFIECALTFDEIYKHFRKFLTVKTEDGQQLYFRFYDPRVLRIFLPTCDKQQLLEFFGPVKYFIAEDEDPDFILKFFLRNDELIKERMNAANIFGNHRPLNMDKPSIQSKANSNSQPIEQTLPPNNNPWID